MVKKQRFETFPRNIFLNFKDYTKEKDLKGATACNYKKYGIWVIIIYLHRIHKNSKYKKVAERVNDLFLQEYFCAIMRKNTKEKAPPCETEEFSKLYRCHCLFPLDHGMRLKIKS